MSMADDMIDDMLCKMLFDSPRRVETIKGSAATARANGAAHSMDAIRKHSRSPDHIRKKRFEALFPKNGLIPEWELHPGAFYPLTSICKAQLMDEIRKIPESDWILDKRMDLPKEPPSTYLGGWYEGIDNWHEAIKSLFEYEIQRRWEVGLKW